MVILNKEKARALVTQATTLLDTSVSVWYGTTNRQVELLNDDGSRCYARIVGISNDRFLSITDLYSITDIFVRVLLISEEPPVTTELYWVSRDDGLTFNKLEFLNYEEKLGQYTIRFRQKSNG